MSDERLAAAEIIRPERLADLRKKADELLAIFTTILKNARSN